MKLKSIVLLTTLISPSAFAGYVNHTQVSVNTGTKTAYGSLVGARNSADNQQYIGCAYVGVTNNPYGICHSRNAAGTSGYCTTTQAHHVEQIRGLSNESYLYYQWDENGKCTYIYSGTNSYYHE
ncbi:hypothetical protein [Aliikangiella sp. IMCC44359]|uniref:hypothetical protein n=1 Tax=Aliikangiella sp. IMCC44359 TaxID=3459125 RepID=UPI00403AD1AD